MKQPHCVIHCRVSTGKQAYEGESLETQAKICKAIAERNGWALAHEPWLEAYSGRKSARPAFEEVLAFVDENPGLVTHYVFRAIDRLTRGGVLFYARIKQELSSRGVILVDSLGVIQPVRNTLEHTGFEYDWSLVSPSEIAEVVMAATANAEVSTILTRLIGQEISLTRQGYAIRPPQDGFTNERVTVDGRKRTVRAPSDRAHFFRLMFELRAAGELSDDEIVERLNRLGYRRRYFQRWNRERTAVIGQGGGGKLTVKRFQEIIKRPIYCGVICEKWTNGKPVQAQFDGLVSIDVWNAANQGSRYIRQAPDGLELLFDSDPRTAKQRRMSDNPDFPYKNVILCPICRKPFMGSASRGRSGKRFPAYHCDRNHDRVARSKATFEQAMADYLDGLKFRPDVVQAIMAGLLQRYRERAREIADEAKLAEREIARLEQEQAEAVAAFKRATSDVTRRVLESDIERLESDIKRAAPNAHEELAEAELRDYIAEARPFLEQPHILLKEPASPVVLKSRFERTFDTLPTLTQIESRTAKLSLIYWLCEGGIEPDAASVRLRGLSWNQLLLEILRHKDDCDDRRKKST